ncbi:hypothetical protein Tco_0856943 [Tanacetum coccineum]|uniref:Uncharacterized protein n=1 Tax=Tanacetum coccineum TaxID=301880 RepID=A0ABQ5B8Q8_9ASTR
MLSPRSSIQTDLEIASSGCAELIYVHFRNCDKELIAAVPSDCSERACNGESARAAANLSNIIRNTG